MPDSLIDSVILPLDIKTIIFVVGAQCACQAAIFIYLWQVQKTYLPAKRWALGAFLRAVGLLFISARDIMPLWASIVFGNSFLIIGDLCFNFGIVEAAERKPPWRVGLCLLYTSRLGRRRKSAWPAARLSRTRGFAASLFTRRHTLVKSDGAVWTSIDCRDRRA